MKETLFLECMDYQHLTRDRPLGYTELHLNELAAEADSEEYPYKSTGKKAEAANLKFEKGNFKGQLHYEAEFIPALALKNFEFSTGGNDIQNPANGGDSESIVDGDGGSVSSSDIEAEAVPPGITTRGPLGVKKENNVRNTGSTDTALTADADLDANPATDSPSESEGKGRSGKGVVLSKEELMQHRKSRYSLSASKLSPRFQNLELSFSTSPPPSCRGRLVLRFCWMMHTGPRSRPPWLAAAT